MNKFKSKIKNLLEIYNIPIQEKWDKMFGNGIYSPYKYWANTRLIDNEKLNRINSSYELVESNKTITRFFKNFDYYYGPKYYQNGSVADIGSGFGFITFWLLLSGADEVYTTGDRNRITFIERLYNKAKDRGLLNNGKIIFNSEFIKVGDTTLDPNVKNNTLSAVFLYNTLEHITPRIYPSLVKSTYNNLKTGGVFISKQQNTDSSKKMKKLMQYWDKVEQTRHIPKRKKFIRNELKNINESDLDILAQKTRGLDSLDLKKAIANFRENRTFPDNDPNLPSICINSDVADEGDTSISRIIGGLKEHDFNSVKVYPAIRATNQSSLAKKSIVNSLQKLMNIFPYFFLKKNIYDKTTIFVAIK